MISHEYKGVAGGDPSRRLPKVKMAVPCHECTAPIEFMGNGKSVPVLFCSAQCTYVNRKNETLKSLRKHGINLTPSKNRSATSLSALLNVCEMIQMVSKGKKIYESPKKPCATCNELFSYLSPVPIKNVRLYCSPICNKNRKSRVKDKTSDVLCPRPEKLKFTSLTDADKHLATMMDDDIARNNDLTSYVCPCGHVHFGSKEKSIFEIEERQLTEKKMAKLSLLLAKKPHLKVKSANG
jgi:endogenous inhibitor of DNA gyrase (YacG/DUF329 family)